MTLEDKPVLDAYLQEPGERASERAFGNLFIWQDCYNIYWCSYRDFLLVRVKRGGSDFFLPPLGGKTEELPAALEAIKAYEGQAFALRGIAQSAKERLAVAVPELVFEEDRDNWDYVYLREKLAALSGRKLHGQKNHYNAFLRDHPDYCFEPISAANLHECASFAYAWCDSRAMHDPSIGEERLAISRALGNFEALGLRGGLIRIDGRVQAFGYGSKINDDTAVLHVEKANPGIRGLYTAICKECAEKIWGDVIYLNREEDMGHETLRQAKQALHPEFMVEKFSCTYRGGPCI